MTRAVLHSTKQWLALARESSFRADALSQRLSVCRRQLQRYTNRLFGLSPQHWLNEQRLVLAPECLEKEGCVKSVAYQLGFKQVSHFSREFRRFYGISPNKFLIREFSAPTRGRGRNLNSPPSSARLGYTCGPSPCRSR
jgi:AraC-like DNA-binding protein